MKKLLLVLFSIFVFGNSSAQDVRTCSDDDFRRFAWHLVSEGNRQYDRSFRTGIQLYADSLELVLKTRHDAGVLQEGDSLEFTADLLKLRADWHYENGGYDDSSYAKAEALFRQAIEMYASHSSMPKGLNGLPMLQREMAQLMYKVKRYGEALEFTDAAYQAYVRADDQIGFDPDDLEYTTLLELKSQMAMCLARTGKTDEAIALMDELLEAYPKASEGYHEVLRKKGKILMLSGRAGCAEEALPLYKEFLTWRKADALATLGTMTSAEREDYWMRMRPFVADCYQLEDADPSFLYDVTLFAKGLLLQLNRISGRGKASEEALASLQHTWSDIQQALPAEACAIEFVQYEKADQQLMGAIVLPKEGQPKWVQMMAPEEFYNYEIGEWTVKSRLYTTEGTKKNSMYLNEALQTSLWNDELRSLVGGCRKVYFAPDGYLHQLAFEYMIPDEMDKVEVYRLSSTRRLLEDSSICTDSALIVGGVKYEAQETPLELGNDAAAYLYVLHSHPYARSYFSYLKGSLTECENIYSQRFCAADTLLVGEQATEQAVRTLVNRFSVLNISTHGQFGASEVPQSSDIKTTMTDESLSQCVIALAGANTSIANTDFDANFYDGMLSAREICVSNFSNVDLAVISACQTGLGYVTADGVFGIQRGLKNAGVKSIVVSLWNVSDEASCMLMSQFHQKLNEGMKIHDAFMAARNVLLEDDYDSPQFYNAFILIDAIE